MSLRCALLDIFGNENCLFIAVKFFFRNIIETIKHFPGSTFWFLIIGWKDGTAKRMRIWFCMIFLKLTAAVNVSMTHPIAESSK